MSQFQERPDATRLVAAADARVLGLYITYDSKTRVEESDSDSTRHLRIHLGPCTVLPVVRLFGGVAAAPVGRHRQRHCHTGPTWRRVARLADSSQTHESKSRSDKLRFLRI